VSFAYQPGRPVLSDISFEIRGGEAVGVIGPSGAGKSTLVQLLLNLRAPDEGRYLINGALVQQFRQDDWQARVAYVPQEPRLVHASVAENIRYFRDLDDDAVARGAQLLMAMRRLSGLAPTRSQADNSRGSVSHVRSPPNRRSSSWTSQPVHSTRARRLSYRNP
jgi:ABC-type multidrug transport system fused ATPase/permease subunit